MKTISSAYIAEIKAQMRVINESLKKVQEAEKDQYTATNNRSYDKAKKASQEASQEVMVALEEVVRLASAIGCATDLYEIHKCHSIVEFDIRDSIK